MTKGLEHLSCKQGLRELGMSSTEETKLRGILSTYVIPEGRVKEASTRLLSVVPSDETRGNGCKSAGKRVLLNLRKPCRSAQF